MSRLSAFSNLVINFDHDKRCARKCFLMDPKQKATLTGVQSPNLLTPEFVKGCIKIVNCNARLGEVEAAREAVDRRRARGSVRSSPEVWAAVRSDAAWKIFFR